MKTSLWLRWLLAAMAISALVLFAACGDDDDDGGNNNDQDDSSEPTRDTDDDNENDSGGATGDEEEYVADLCSAYLEFQDTIIAIGTDPENADATDEEGLELVREPFEALLQAVEDADPPGDVEEFHDSIVDTFRDTLDRIEDGDITVFEEDAGAIPEPPQAIQDKYSSIAADNATCQEANFSFGG